MGVCRCLRVVAPGKLDHCSPRRVLGAGFVFWSHRLATTVILLLHGKEALEGLEKRENVHEREREIVPFSRPRLLHACFQTCSFARQTLCS